MADLERQLEAALKEIQTLREENARLRRELEEWKRGHRERSKRRSSRAEGQLTGEKKRPGRKLGHPGAQRPVPTPDRQVTYPVPDHCECGGCVEPIDETVATIVQDIPVVRSENVEHVAQAGRCILCGRRVVAKLPGAVDAGQSIARVQLGPNAQSLIISLRYEYRTPLRGIASILGTWFGIEITAGAVSQLIDRWRDRSVESYTGNRTAGTGSARRRPGRNWIAPRRRWWLGMAGPHRRCLVIPRGVVSRQLGGRADARRKLSRRPVHGLLWCLHGPCRLEPCVLRGSPDTRGQESG